MKIIAPLLRHYRATIAPILCCLLLNSCAKTVFYDKGEPIAMVQGDIENFRYYRGIDGTITILIDSLDHSTATEAQGKAFAIKATAVGSATAAAAAGAATAILLK